MPALEAKPRKKMQPVKTSKQQALLPTQADSADFSEIAELGTKFIKEKGEAGYPPPMSGQDYNLMVDSETWYGTDWVHHQNAAKAMTHIEPWMVAAIKMHESAPACGAKAAISILKSGLQTRRGQPLGAGSLGPTTKATRDGEVTLWSTPR